MLRLLTLGAVCLASLAGCSAHDDAASGTTDAVGTVSGAIVEHGGGAVAALPLSVCDPTICFMGSTSADGRFAVHVGRAMHGGALTVGNAASAFAPYLLPVASGDTAYATPLVVARWPADGDAFPDVGTAKALASAGCTLSLDASTTVTWDVLTVDDAHAFRALEVAPGELGPFGAGVASGTRLVALGPPAATLSPAVTLTLANTRSWPAGASVDVRLLGTETVGTPGVFGRVASAHVTSDGAAIRTDDGAGITTLGWLALSLAP